MNLCLSRKWPLLVLAAFLVGGCTFARYTKVRVQVVDDQSHAGISGTQVSTFYIKPMLDMTCQRHDHELTDSNGFATLTVATNTSQRMILGWTYGIFTSVTVQAQGYRSEPNWGTSWEPLDTIGFPRYKYNQTHPLLIPMTGTNEIH